MLHYYAKKFFAPVVVTADLRNDGVIEINLISDSLDDAENVTIQIDIFRWDSMEPVNTFRDIITVVNLKRNSSRGHQFLSYWFPYRE